jgi:phosphotriesterase-related protein
MTEDQRARRAPVDDGVTAPERAASAERAAFAARPAAPAVRTVLGDVEPGALDVTDAHDHLFFRSVAMPGAELDDAAAAEAELRAFKAVGGGTVVQWTPHGLGRRVPDLARLSRATGVHIVAATGLHQAVHYAPDRLAGLRDPDRLAALFVRHLTQAPAAGLIKVAGAFHGLDAHARLTMTAAADAHHATGAPIAVHLEQGTAATAVLDLLCQTLGVPPHRVILGHLNRFPDPGEHREAAQSGAFLAFDGPSRAHHATDWRLVEALAALASAGHADQLLLGGDTTTAEARAATGGGPGMPGVLTALRPRVARALGETATGRLLTANPARAFGVPWRAGVVRATSAA